MNQENIGKFIAALRKEQNMTQLDLATKLGITDRAVSKWENGRGMPDFSLIKPLCEALNITVNELFAGEKILQDNISEIADKNIVSTLSYSQSKIKKTKITLLSVLFGTILIISLVIALFAIDVDRMRNNKPVFFSTWGFDYTPPVDFRDDEIKLAIKDYLILHGDAESKHEDGVKTFVAFKTYLIEEKGTITNVYCWVLEEQLYLHDKEVKNYSGYSMPIKFMLELTDGEYKVIDSRFPRDGSYYSEDLTNLFPKDVRTQLDNVYKDGTIERLKIEIEEQVKLYFHEAY